MSCIFDFLLYDVTQREINNNNVQYGCCELGGCILYSVKFYINTLVLTFNFVPLDSRCPNTWRIYDNNNNNGGLRVQLPTLPISKSIFFQQSG